MASSTNPRAFLGAASAAGDYAILLWLLKLGSLINLYFLVRTQSIVSGTDIYIVAPAQILFAVSAYRCLFPVRYEGNVVFHDSAFSSIFLTRLLATFSEVAYIFLFSYVLRLLNAGHAEWVDALSWLMVAQVVISQVFVWGAVLTGRLKLYFYEEIGWAVIFAANAIASAFLYLNVDALPGEKVLLVLNLLFGAVYLPWQFFHLASLRKNARNGGDTIGVAAGLRQALRVKNRQTDADAWGGLIGLTWMTGYWATLIPMWVYNIVVVLSPR